MWMWERKDRKDGTRKGRRRIKRGGGEGRIE